MIESFVFLKEEFANIYKSNFLLKLAIFNKNHKFIHKNLLFWSIKLKISSLQNVVSLKKWN